MKNMTVKKVSRVFFLAALILSLIVPAAQAEECSLYGQHQFSTYVYFEADHPHKQYVVCDCGYAKYTGGTQYYSECEICNPKDSVDIQTVTVELAELPQAEERPAHGPQIAVLPQAEECPLYGQHQFGTYVQFEADHPHKQYVVCDCGYVKYTGGTQYYSECEICNPKEPDDIITVPVELEEVPQAEEPQAEECPVHGQHQFGTYVYFEADHPHKQYVVCDCGYAKYTGGTQYYSECEICNPKELDDIETVPVELEEVPQAEEPQAVECPLYGQHQFGTYVYFEADHPHKQYVVCDCGYAKYTGGTQYYSECEICNPKELVDNETVTTELPELEQEQQQVTHPDDDARMSEEYKTSIFYKQLKEVDLTGEGDKDILAVALSQDGYHEGALDGTSQGGVDNNIIEYNRFYGDASGAYCAYFVSWCAGRAKIDGEVIQLSPGATPGLFCPTGNVYLFFTPTEKNANWSLDKAVVHENLSRDSFTPQPGDLIFFNWGGKTDETPDHVGIVISSDDNYVTYIDGNSGDEGIGVTKHTKSLTWTSIVAYCRPNY